MPCSTALPSAVIAKFPESSMVSLWYFPGSSLATTSFSCGGSSLSNVNGDAVKLTLPGFDWTSSWPTIAKSSPSLMRLNVDCASVFTLSFSVGSISAFCSLNSS